MRRSHPPEPWHSFFLDIDKIFDQPIALQCIGGFAIAMLYGLPRPTVDVDFLSVVPAGEIGRLDALAGMRSALDGKHGVHLQHVGIVTVPENYEDRLIPIFPVAYRKVPLARLEAHDLALSKLERNSGRDREDVKFLARAAPRRSHDSGRPVRVGSAARISRLPSGMILPCGSGWRCAAAVIRRPRGSPAPLTSHK